MVPNGLFVLPKMAEMGASAFQSLYIQYRTINTANGEMISTENTQQQKHTLLWISISYNG